MIHVDTIRKAAGVTILPLAVALTSPASAAEQADFSPVSESSVTVPDIIVTARKVPESIEKTPLSISTLTSQTIQRAGLTQLSDVTALAPNIDISGGIAGQLQGQISIRGISTLARNIGLETGVSLYLDGVYMGRPENLGQTLIDVEQIEILRGPQGTEFGKNTIAGVLHIKTRLPDESSRREVRAELGNYGLVSSSVSLSGPVGNGLSVGGSVGYSSRSGYYRHLSGGKNADSLDLLSWRAVAAYRPASDLSFILRADGLSDRGTPGFFQASRLAGYPDQFPSNAPLHINNNRPNYLARDTNGVSFTAEFAQDEMAITSITSYRKSKYDASLDDDQEQVDFLAEDNFSDSSKIFSQELRVSGNRGPFSYLAGAYYLDQAVTTDRRLAIGADLGILGQPGLSTKGRVDTISKALFARLDYKPIEPLTISAGLRFTNEAKKANFTQNDEMGVFTYLGFPNLQFASHSSDSDFSPTFTGTLEIASHTNIYGRYAKGFKSAAFNIDLASSVNGLTASPEKAENIEFGLKSLLFDKRLRLNFAAFHTNYDALQVSQLLGSGITLTNAGKATSKGLEAEATMLAAEGLLFEASASYLNAKYDRFPNCGIPLSLGGGVADCSGNDLVLAPHFTWHGAAQYNHDVGNGEFFVRTDVDYRSSVYFEPTNSDRFRASNRTLVNVRVGFKMAQWQIDGWIKNVADKIYKTYSDDRSAVGVFQTSAYGPPRTFGTSISAHF